MQYHIKPSEMEMFWKKVWKITKNVMILSTMQRIIISEISHIRNLLFFNIRVSFTPMQHVRFMYGEMQND